MKTFNTPRGGALVAVALVIAGISACGERDSDIPPSSAASPSAVVIGVVPAEATGDTAQTTPVTQAASEVSKPVEQKSMPLPGQANDHSNLAARPSQKAGAEEVLKSPELAKSANAEKPAERTQ